MPEKVSDRQEAYRAFFQKLIDELRDKDKFTGARTGRPQAWYAFSSGVKGVLYSASFAQNKRVRAEVYIDRGEKLENKELFERLQSAKAEIETGFGESLHWERLDDRRASRVAVYRDGSIEDVQNLEEIRAWMRSRLLKFKHIIGSHLNHV